LGRKLLFLIKNESKYQYLPVNKFLKSVTLFHKSFWRQL